MGSKNGNQIKSNLLSYYAPLFGQANEIGNTFVVKF